LAHKPGLPGVRIHEPLAFVENPSCANCLPPLSPPGFLALPVLLALLAGCSATPEAPAQRVHAPDAAIGKLWQWEETVTPVERVKALAPERYTLAARSCRAWA
jgi:hypothetical protein